MRWPWRREPVKDEAAAAKIEELTPRHQQALKRARRIFAVASRDIEKLITDDYALAEEQRVARKAKP